MKIKYSKPNKDIIKESDDLIEMEERLVLSLSKINSLLRDCPLRENCVLCGESLKEMPLFEHRKVEFKVCSECDHRQSAAYPTPEFESAAMIELGFDVIYPKLDFNQYRSRRDRIYTPKRDWLIDVLIDRGFSHDQLKAKSWFELGAGSGYFLNSMQDYGATKLSGVDASDSMVKISNEALGDGVIIHTNSSASETIRNHDADIYCAFFVLEHLNDTADMIEELAAKQSGTIFVFAVPVFGLITAFESILDHHAARNLDGMTHTQVFSERSIQYFLNKMDYEMIGQWVFGQDVQDLFRFLSVNLKNIYPEKMRSDFLGRLSTIVDPMQSVIDQGLLADARHIVAIKR